jgi:hypothetical protein
MKGFHLAYKNNEPIRSATINLEAVEVIARAVVAAAAEEAIAARQRGQVCNLK